MQIADGFLKEIAIRYHFIEEDKFKNLQELQKKLQQNKIPKTMIEIFQYKKIFSENRFNELEKLVLFFEQRIYGSIFCYFAIEKKWIDKEDYNRCLTTHRSIFKVKKDCISLSALLIHKGLLEESKSVEIEEQIRSLPEKKRESLWSEYQKSINNEDKKNLEWRKKQQKILSSQTEEDIGFEENPNPDPPESPLELKNSSETSSKISIEITPTKKTKKASDLANLSVKELPPSKIEESNNKINLSKNTVLHNEETFSLGTPVEKEQKRTILLSFVVAVIAFAILTVAFWFINRSDIREIEKISYLVEVSENAKAEEKARDFVKRYPKSEHLKTAKKHLQKLLINRAQISSNQQRIEEALKIINEANEIVSETDYDDKAKELKLQILSQETQIRYRKNFDEQVTTIQDLLKSLKIEDANDLIKQTYFQYEGEEWAKKNLSELSQAYEEAQKKYMFSKYQYTNNVSSAKTMQTFETPNNINIEKLPLGEIHQDSIIGTTNFLTIAQQHLYCFDGDTGIIKWIQKTQNTEPFYPIFLAGPKQNFNMRIADKALVVVKENCLRMVQCNDGAVIWETALPGIVSSQPVVYKRHIYVGTLNHYCVQLDVVSGNIVGAYQTGESPIYEASFDSKLNLIYIPCRANIYIFSIGTGKIVHIIPYENSSCSPLIIASPYMLSFEKNLGNTVLQLYRVSLNKYNVVKTITISGNMNSPPQMSCGNLAIATDKKLEIFALNTINTDEAIFSLNESYPIPLTQRSFMLFSNLGRTLTISGDKLFQLQIQPFSKKQNVIDKKWELEYGNTRQHTYEPILRTSNMFFTTRQEGDNFSAAVFETDHEDKPKLLWEKPFALNAVADFTTLPDKRMIITTIDGSLHELFLENNNINYRILASQLTNGTEPPVFINREDGQLLVTTPKNTLVLLDSVTGWPIDDWQVGVNLNGSLSGAIVENETIFLGCAKSIFAINVNTGKKQYLEFSEFKGEAFSTKPFFYDNSIFVGNNAGFIYQLKINSQAKVPFLEKHWFFDAKSPIKSNPICYKNTLYFGCDQGHLYAIDINTKKTKWLFDTTGRIRSQVVVDENMIYCGSDARNFSVLNAQNGQLLWQKNMKGQMKASPLIHNEKIYVVTVAGEIYCFDKTGRELWYLEIPGSITTTPVIIGNKIMFAGHDGFLYFITEKE